MTRELPDVGPDSKLGDRMRAAIKGLGFDNVKAFAAANNLAYESLISVLSGRRGLSAVRLKTYADMLEVPTKWLRDGPNGHASPVGGIEVRKIISWNFSPIGTIAGGNALRRAANPHLVKRVEPPFVVPGLKQEGLFAAYCDGTTDVGLVEGTMMLCSEYKAGAVPDSTVAASIVGYLLREDKHDTERVLPFLRQYDNIYACPAMPTNALQLPADVPPHHEIIGVIHAFWRAVLRN